MSEPGLWALNSGHWTLDSTHALCLHSATRNYLRCASCVLRTPRHSCVCVCLLAFFGVVEISAARRALRNARPCRGVRWAPLHCTARHCTTLHDIAPRPDTARHRHENPTRRGCKEKTLFVAKTEIVNRRQVQVGRAAALVLGPWTPAPKNVDSLGPLPTPFFFLLLIETNLPFPNTHQPSTNHQPTSPPTPSHKPHHVQLWRHWLHGAAELAHPCDRLPHGKRGRRAADLFQGRVELLQRVRHQLGQAQLCRHHHDGRRSGDGH